MKLEKNRFVADLEQRVKKQTDELKAVYFSVLSSLAQAMEKKDIGTYGHCRRVSYCARLIAAAATPFATESPKGRFTLTWSMRSLTV